MARFNPVPVTPRPGQESVWDYPRPAIAERTKRHLLVRFEGRIIADTRQGIRTLETSHPPTYYFPPQDVAPDPFRPNGHKSLCEWKGQARYHDLVVGDRQARAAAWSYGAPTPAFEILKGHFAFYPGLVDACFVDGEQVQPQPGNFYGGWITSHVAGPFKGDPGTLGW